MTTTQALDDGAVLGTTGISGLNRGGTRVADANKGEWIALLKRQVNAAEEREDRWRRLGQQLKFTNQQIWKNIASLRQSEVQHLRVLLKEAQLRQQ